MADQALYRRYRPTKFVDLVGQEAIRTTLQNAVKLNALSHAYLFCGTRGTGKTSTARLVARAINCETIGDDGEPCGECGICGDIESGRLIDLIEIDAASNRGIDEIRDLKEKLHFAPTRAKAKIYIIDEVHMLTKEAFNALLKTLEEPPSHSYFILATTEVHKIPETIISRCQRFDFKRINEDSLVGRLKFIAGEEGIEADEKALGMIVKHVNGGMRDAIGLLEQLSGSGKIDVDEIERVLGVRGDETLEKLYQLINNGDSDGGLKLVEEMFVQGQDFSVFVRNFLWFLRGKMVKSVYEGQNSEAYQVLAMIETIHRVSEQLGSAPIPQLPLEAAIVKLCAGKEKKVQVAAAPGNSVAQNSTTAKTIVKSTVVKTTVSDGAVISSSPEKVKLEKKEGEGGSQEGVESGSAANLEGANGSSNAKAEAAKVDNNSEVEAKDAKVEDANDNDSEVKVENVKTEDAKVEGEDIEKADAESKSVETVGNEESKESEKSTGSETNVANGDGALDKEELVARWQEVIGKISNPALRMSFKQGKIGQITGNEVVVEFGTKFHFERVSQAKDIDLVEIACLEILSKKVKISTSLNEKLIEERQAEEKAKDEELLQKAEELFS